VGGQPVRSWLNQLKPGTYAPIAQAAGIATGILEGLAYAHQRGIIHRHIQPKNIILSDDRVTIMNFGLADPPQDTWSDAEIVYMPPEQLAGQKLSASSDLYAFGVFVYELLTRKLPFQADTRPALIEQCMSVSPRAPSELNPSIPPQIEDLLLALMAKEPHNRPQTAHTVLRRLAKGWTLAQDSNVIKQIA
jgi:serine/threonine-protein kinase